MHVVTSTGEINQNILLLINFDHSIINIVSLFKPVRMEAVVSEMKRQLEAGDLELDQKINLLNDGINGETVFTLPVCSA